MRFIHDNLLLHTNILRKFDAHNQKFFLLRHQYCQYYMPQTDSLISRDSQSRVKSRIYEWWKARLTERYLGSNLMRLPRYHRENELSPCKMKMAPTLLINRASPAFVSSLFLPRLGYHRRPTGQYLFD